MRFIDHPWRYRAWVLFALIAPFAVARAAAAADIDALLAQFQQSVAAGQIERAVETAHTVLRSREARANPQGKRETEWSFADTFDGAQRYLEAATFYALALESYEAANAATDDIATLSYNLARCLYLSDRHAEAADKAALSVKLWRERGDADRGSLVESLHLLASIHQDMGRYAEAEEPLREAVAILESIDAGGARLRSMIDRLAVTLQSRSKFDEAEQLYLRNQESIERSRGADSLEYAENANNLATLYMNLGRLAEAERLLKQCVATREKRLAADDERIGQPIENLGLLYIGEGRFAEAEPLLRRALDITRKANGENGADTARTLNNVALLYESQGRYAEAEPIYQSARGVLERAHGHDHPLVASVILNLANVNAAQGRYAEAEKLARETLAIREKVLGPDHPDVADALATLAWTRGERGALDEALSLMLRAIDIKTKRLGDDYARLPADLCDMAEIRMEQARHDEAEKLYDRALALAEAKFGPDDTSTGTVLEGFAELRLRQDRAAEAEVMADRALAIADRTLDAPGTRAARYALRAKIVWKLGHTSEAVADLKRAMDLAEEQRGLVSGREQERATAFSEYAYIFESMVEWQRSLGDMSEMLAAMERARARSLLDEMMAAGVDLDLGLSLAEREAAAEEEKTLKTQVAEIEARRSRIDDATSAEAKQLDAQLAAAKAKLYAHYRDRRNANTTYRGLLSVGAAPPRLSQIERVLASHGERVLVYLLGDEASYVLSIAGDGAVGARIEVDEATARELGIEPGPLTAERLKQVLVDDQGGGVVRQLSRPDTALLATPRLAALWTLLVPERDRQAILSRQAARLTIVPDGPLALLPFETLALPAEDGAAADGDTRYLLDVAPPISYAPSTTVLFNLVNRPAVELAEDMPVLSVGEPDYSNASPAATDTTLLASANPRSRFRSAGASLAALPFSGVESSWVKRVFDPAGMLTGRLTKETATEAAVRAAVPGRSIIHLACHGLTDNEYGNFFGALALTRGPKAASDPLDDGFLTLGEVYSLDLKRCELAILSACQTNYGPQQRGEGTWALSRGFLVAGARRVVASNWLVDDEAAASLVSYFCGGLATAHKQDSSLDYARSLSDAKLWVRRQEKWSNPYYWATFVLVGPN